MLYRHVFDKTSTEFRRISQISLNFAAPRPLENNIRSPELGTVELNISPLYYKEQCQYAWNKQGCQGL